MSRLVTLFLTIAIFGGSFLIGIVATSSDSFGQPKTDEEIQSWIDKEVAKSQKVIPQDCGNGVTWFRVEGGDKSINYSYRVDLPSEHIRAARKQVEKGMKSSLMLKWMIPKEVKAYASIYNQNGDLVYRIPINY